MTYKQVLLIGGPAHGDQLNIDNPSGEMKLPYLDQIEFIKLCQSTPPSIESLPMEDVPVKYAVYRRIHPNEAPQAFREVFVDTWARKRVLFFEGFEK